MTTLQPIEAVEQLYPVRIERTVAARGLRRAGASGAAASASRGRCASWRRSSRLSVLAEKAVLPPFGVCGGGAGATNRFWVRRGEQPIQPSPLPGKVGGFPLRAAATCSLMESSGGGGFGDPLDRDPARGRRRHRRGLRHPGGRGARSTA